MNLCSCQQAKGHVIKVFCAKAYFKYTFQSWQEFTAQVQILNLKTHTAITRRYTVTSSELSKWIFKPIIYAAFNFIWKIYMTRQQALLAIFIFF